MLFIPKTNNKGKGTLLFTCAKKTQVSWEYFKSTSLTLISLKKKQGFYTF